MEIFALYANFKIFFLKNGWKKTNFELNYPKHAVTMVTDFQRKSSKLQCSGEDCQCVQ
jgi:hypothetical protein